MATANDYGISIHLSDTLLATENLIGFGRLKDVDWATLSNSYTHTIGADIGFDSMSFSLSGSSNDIEDWLEGGLARHVTAYNKNLTVIWEGFVNSMSATIGSVSVKRGPLLDIVNRSRVDYKTINWDVIPPSPGSPASTGYNGDADSQGRYGIFVEHISGGEGTEAQVETLRDSYIEENKLPKTDQGVTLGSAGVPQITIECLGYYHLLSKYYYEQTSDAGTINASAKIIDVLGADPNGILAGPSVFYRHIDTNTVQVPDYEDGTRKADGIIKDIISYGDSSFNRYTFGVYEDQLPYYTQQTSTYWTEPSYFHRISESPSVLYEYESAREVQPWDVRPARWLFISDLMLGLREPSGPANFYDLREDPRSLFIESVNFSLPYNLKIEGGKLYKFEYRLAQHGLSGM